MDLKTREKCQLLASSTTVTTSRLSPVIFRFSRSVCHWSRFLQAQSENLNLHRRMLHLEIIERVRGCACLRKPRKKISGMLAEYFGEETLNGIYQNLVLEGLGEGAMGQAIFTSKTPPKFF